MSAAPRTTSRLRAAAIAVVLLSLGSTTACTRTGTGISMTNSADDVVTVRSDDGDVTEIDPDGGAFIYTDDCLEAPLVVTYAGGEEISFGAPLCPGQELLIQDGSVRIVEPSFT